MNNLNLNLVYYIFINPTRNWKVIVEGQINDLKASGLIYNTFYVHICCEQPELINSCKSIIDAHFQEIVYSESYINRFEYPGLKLLYDLSNSSNDIFLYFHSKGMVFNNDHSIRSITEKPALRATLFYWKKAILLFENENINKIGLFPSDQGYIWLNFFYIRGGYLKQPPLITDYRYYYEEYIGKCDYKDCYSLLLDRVGYYDKYSVMETICNLKDNKKINDIDIHFSKLLPTFTIFYGTVEQRVDVTQTAFNVLLVKNIIYIPSGDNERYQAFNIDPVPGVLKSIFIVYQGHETVYEYYSRIYIDITQNRFYQRDELPNNIKQNDIYKRLERIHSTLKIDHGEFSNEYPEQIMTTLFMKPDSIVLEIGANIGRNSLVIASILNDSKNLLSIECNDISSSLLDHNRRLNGFEFCIETSAISKRPLIQRGWDTMVSEELLDGYTRVNTITYPDFVRKWNKNFDTLVIDCEGAFYYILLDFPEILNNIKLIIMENDYHDITHKQEIDSHLRSKGFDVIYSRSGGWGPCTEFFYETWNLI